MKIFQLSESKRESSHKAYGRVAITSEDGYGELVDFGEKVDDKEYKLDPQLGLCTSCPIG